MLSLATVLSIYLFFLALGVPGLALVLRFAPAVCQRGLLSVVARSYLASCLLLSPVSIACYLLRLPVTVFTATFLTLVAAALGMLVRERAGGRVLALVRAEPVLPWLLLLLALWMQARAGAHLAGDAYFHVGHVRHYLQHGFSNREIYFAQEYFHSIYHTNLLYAVYATAAQLADGAYLETWFATQPVAKLLAAAGHYSLAYALSRDRRVAFCTALAVVAATLGERYTLYPNTLCVMWLLPTLLGEVIGWLSGGEDEPRPILWAAGTSFVLGELHSLYAVYAALLLGPLLLCVAVVRRARRAASWRAPLLGLLALLAGAPFALVSRFAPVVLAEPSAASTPASDGEPSAAPVIAAPAVPLTRQQIMHTQTALGGGHLEKQLATDASGRPVFLVGEMGGLAFVVGGMLALVLVSTRRDALALRLALACAALLCVLLFIPAACAAAVAVLRDGFVVARLATVLASFVLVGWCALLVHYLPLPSWLVILAVAVAATQLPGQSPRTAAQAYGDAVAPAVERYAELRALEQRRALYARAIPRGATVVTTLRGGRTLPMICDCYVIAADRGHTNVPDIARRRADVVRLNDKRTPAAARGALLARYRARHVIFEERRQRSYRWALASGVVLGNAGGHVLVELAPAP